MCREAIPDWRGRRPNKAKALACVAARREDRCYEFSLAQVRGGGRSCNGARCSAVGAGKFGPGFAAATRWRARFRLRYRRLEGACPPAARSPEQLECLG